MKLKPYWLFTILILFILSCNHSAKVNKAVAHHKSVIQNTDSIVNEHKLAIDYPCAVIVIPSDKAIMKLKKTYSEDDYNTIVDDNQNYMDESLTFLDSVKAKQIQRQSSGEILFKTALGKTFEMKLDTLGWAILLFNGTDKPIVSDMTVFADNYRAYMK